MIQQNQRCAKVRDGAVASTGTFAKMIAPASSFREGFPEDRAKAEFSIYPIIRPTFDATTERLVSVTPYYDAEADAVYSATVSPIPVDLMRASKANMINSERDRRWPGTVQVDVNGDGTLIVPVDARDDTDLRNITAITVAAQEYKGNPNALMPFRDANDTTHDLTPAQTITLGLTVQGHIQAVYAKAWALKDSIDSMTSVELDQLDVTSNTHWE